MVLTYSGAFSSRIKEFSSSNEFHFESTFFYTCNGAIWIETSGKALLENSLFQGSYIDPVIIIISQNISMENNCIFGCSSTKFAKNDRGDIIYCQSKLSVTQNQNSVASCSSSTGEGYIYVSLASESQIFTNQNFSFNYDTYMSGPVVESKVSMKLNDCYIGNNKCGHCFFQSYKLQGNALITKLLFEKNNRTADSTYGYYHCEFKIDITISESVFIHQDLKYDLHSKSGYITVKNCYFSEKPRFGANIVEDGFESNLLSTITMPIGIEKCPFEKDCIEIEETNNKHHKIHFLACFLISTVNEVS